MAKRLPVPPELEHLIEKREREGDRRERDQRRGADPRQEDLGPLGAIESAGDVNDVPTEDRRTGRERRAGASRRQKRRRKSDS